MGILNVDNLRAVGSGTSVTCLSNRLETTNINASGIITATSFTGTLNTAAQGNITSLGLLTGLAIDDNTDTSMSSSSAGQLKVGGNGYTSAIALDADAMHIYHNSSIRSMVLGTNETERLRITGAGKVGISSDSPIAKLDVSGSGAEAVIRARRTDSNGGWNLFEGRSDINGSNVFTVTNNGVGYFKGGIDFSAQTSTSASGATTSHEVLDHYEEGTWTPTLVNGPAYQSLTARYTRIGNVVYLYFNLYRNESASNTNEIEVTNLPFAMGTYTNSMGMGLAFSYNGSTSRRSGFINTNNANSVKVIKDGTSEYVTYDNFVVNSRALTMKWWYYTA